MGAGPGIRRRLQNRKTLPGRQKQSVERSPGVREKAGADHAFKEIIMQQRNINAKPLSAHCVGEAPNG
jgi:hypothetical protein